MFERKRVRNICKDYVRKLEIMYNNIGIKIILILLWFLVSLDTFYTNDLSNFFKLRWKQERIYLSGKKLYAYCELIVF